MRARVTLLNRLHRYKELLEKFKRPARSKQTMHFRSDAIFDMAIMLSKFSGLTGIGAHHATIKKLNRMYQWWQSDNNGHPLMEKEWGDSWDRAIEEAFAWVNERIQEEMDQVEAEGEGKAHPRVAIVQMDKRQKREYQERMHELPLLARVRVDEVFLQNTDEEMNEADKIPPADDPRSLDPDAKSDRYARRLAMVGQVGTIVAINCNHGCGGLWENGDYDPMYNVLFDEDGPWGEGSFATYDFFFEELMPIENDQDDQAEEEESS